MRVISIVGARPQFVKLAPFSRELRKYHEETIIHTGQHYDTNMSELFFKQLDIPEPDINLHIGSGGHGAQTGKMLSALEEQFINLSPDAVVVFGDTNSTLAGALAASKLHIPCIHIEAGLRSFNRLMPEEINRVVADHTCDLLMAPTRTGMNNLCNEGLEQCSIFTGDIMVDAVQYLADKAEHESRILEKNGLQEKSYYLLTLHRPSNVDNAEQLRYILAQLENLDQPVIFPVHPRTRRFLPESVENIQFIDPVGYIDIISLQRNALKVITDSGGMQKEAYVLGTPCITLRKETEWVETVEAGWNLLLNPAGDILCKQIQSFSANGKQPDIFGNDVAARMVKELGRIESVPSRRVIINVKEDYAKPSF